MPRNNRRTFLQLSFAGLWLAAITNSYAMGLRSFVALPVDKNGTVVRFVMEQTEESDTDNLITSMAYGLTAKQTLLLSLPYRISPSGEDPTGDLSALYRHITWQKDSYSGTKRFGLLGGMILPTENDRDSAIQAGVVFTYFKNRHEIDLDVLYQAGQRDRANSGQYDISWQYRLSPINRPDWGLVPELNSVLELNGRWLENEDTIHQVTVGLQWIHQTFVIEGGVANDVSNGSESRILLSTRFHF